MIRFCKTEIIWKLQHYGILTAFKHKLLHMSDMWQNALNYNLFLKWIAAKRRRHYGCNVSGPTKKETLKVSDSLSTTKHTKASKCKGMSIIKRYSTRYIECLSSLDDSAQSILVFFISVPSIYFCLDLTNICSSKLSCFNFFSAPQMRCRDIIYRKVHYVLDYRDTKKFLCKNSFVK